MKKWLVGLMAAGLCAASAWAAGVATLPVNCSFTSTQDWTALDGFTGKGVGTYGDGRCKFDSSGDALTVQFDAAPGELTFELKGNTAQTGTAPASFTVESSAGGENWDPVDDIDDSKITSSDYAKFGPYSLDSSARYVRWTYANKYGFNFGLNNVSITSGGPAKFSIKLTPSFSGDSVLVGDEATITASAQNAAGEVTYRWSAEGVPGSASGAVFTIDTSAAGGPYTVTCDANDTESDADPVSVTFSIAEPPEGTDYTLVESLNGLQDGAEVVLTDPDSGYALKAVVDNSVFTVAEVKPVGKVITTDDATIVWKLEADANGNFSLRNADQYAGHAGGGTSNSGRLQTNSFPHAVTFGEDSLFVLTATTADSAGNNRTLQYNYNGGNPRFAYYKGTQKNLRIYAAETGPAEPKIVYTGETTIEVGGMFSLQFTLKNYDGDYSWVVEGGAGSITDEGAFTYKPDDAGTTVIMVKALDGDDNVITQTADIQLTATAAAPKFAVNVADDIQNGTVSTDVSEAAEGDTVIVTATPEDGYRLVEIIVNNGDVAVSGNTFVMPGNDVLVTATFEVKPPVTGDEFTRISSVDGLADGTKVVLTDPDGTLALVANVDNNVFTTAAVEPVDDVITTDDATIIWTLKDDGNGNFSLYNDAAEQYAGHAGGASSNSGRLQTNAFPNAISVADAEASLFLIAATTADGGGAYRDLQYNYNSGKPRFAYYKGTMKNLRIYAAESGPAVFSVTFDKKDGFVVPFETADSITATAKNGSGDYSYEWTGDLTGEGATLAIPATLASGPYTVTVKVTDNQAEIIPIEKSISFTVAEQVVTYDITVERVSGGVLSVEGDKTQAEAGETVKVIATADEGMKLAEITVKGETTDLSFTSSPAEFVMPAEPVTISGTFEEATGEAFTLITSVAGLEDGAEYVITDNSQAYAIKAALSSTSSTRLLNSPVKPVENVITTDDATIIWKLEKDDDGNFALYNESIEKYIGWSSGNSAKLQGDAFANTISYENDLFEVMATSTAGLEKPRKLQFNSSANVLQFAYYEGGQKNLCFFKKSGEAAPKIVYDGETTIDFDDLFDINFELKNYDGSFAWTVSPSGCGSIDSDGHYTWDPSDSGTFPITVQAVDGENVLASKDVTLTVNPKDVPPPSATLTCEPASVTMAVGGSAEVTVTLDGVDSFDGFIYIEEYKNKMCSTQGENPWTFDLADLRLSASDEPYELTLVAFDGEALAQTTLPVTVTDGSQGEQPVITSIYVEGSEVTLTYTGDGSAVQGTDDLSANDWADVSTSIGEGTATAPTTKRFLRIRQ